MKAYIRLILLAYLLVGMPIISWAITQQGYVRTISRPNAPSQRLGGVMLRVRGGHNAVISTDQGDFSILLQELHNGDAYALAAVMKSGYQLAEQELIGRQQAGSEKVPLEVLMVSLKQLQEEKAAIANKAREGVERHYMEQIQALEAALSEQRLTNEQYEQQLAALDDKLMRSEEQIEQMADRYARTDYALLDSLAASIQSAIEQGDLDAAEALIRQKGSLADRRQRILDMQRDLVAQSTDLKRDYYHLYSICLGRFLPDSAAYYLRLRADIDTTDAAAQLDYAKYLNESMRSHEEAYLYTLRAERQILRSGNEHSALMINLLNEKAIYYRQSGSLPEAVRTIEEAIDLSIHLFGKEHHSVAGRRVNLGVLFFQTGKLKEAKKQLEEALRIYHIPGLEDQAAEARVLCNLGGIAYSEKQYTKARTYYEQAVTLLRASAPSDPTLPPTLYNLAGICWVLGDTSSAQQHYEEAYENARRILGENHPFTAEIRSVIEAIK